MKHNNISIFIPHQGCKNACSFCNQNTISGAAKPPALDEVDELLRNAAKQIDEKKAKADTEIAFFGGSFTAINREYMVALLEIANKYIMSEQFAGIRISTRPDAIDDEVLNILKQYHVTSIELGAQSMCDEVLKLNDRGHTAADVIAASKLIKQYGFSLGLQMMVGLYGDTVKRSCFTAQQLVKIKPDTVRIYPTVVLKGTKLAKLFLSGEYQIMPLEEAVSLCADLLLLFKENDIKVIKLGLHASTDVENDMLGGIYHPAFRELCEGEIYLKKAIESLEKLPQAKEKKLLIYVKKSDISKMIGQNKKNMEKLKHMGYNVTVVKKDGLAEYLIMLGEV